MMRTLSLRTIWIPVLLVLSFVKRGSGDGQNHRRLNAALGFCQNALEASSTDGLFVTQSDYLEFRRILSTREQPTGMTEEFARLDLGSVALFYWAACASNPALCGREPVITLRTVPQEEEEHGILSNLCFHVMNDMTVKTSFTFDVIVQFDPKNVSQDIIGTCLESAVKGNLRRGLGCDSTIVPLQTSESHPNRGLDANVDPTTKRSIPSYSRLRPLVHPSHSKGVLDPERTMNENRDHSRMTTNTMMPMSASLSGSVEEPGFGGKHRRLETTLNCPFQITATVLSSLFVQCPRPSEQELLCGLVLLNTTVETTQWHVAAMDDSSSLKSRTQQILQDAIQDDSFEEMFPPECV